MITDSERQEAVENLRILSYANRVRYKEEFYELLDETVMEPDTGYHEMNDVFERLADLIDIPTCVMTNVGGDFENSFQCFNCMNEFDMPDFDLYPYKRCPECGAVVIDAN